LDNVVPLGTPVLSAFGHPVLAGAVAVDFVVEVVLLGVMLVVLDVEVGDVELVLDVEVAVVVLWPLVKDFVLMGFETKSRTAEDVLVDGGGEGLADATTRGST
jgi:hypothetical protein